MHFIEKRGDRIKWQPGLTRGLDRVRRHQRHERADDPS